MCQNTFYTCLNQSVLQSHLFFNFSDCNGYIGYGGFNKIENCFENCLNSIRPLSKKYVKFCQKGFSHIIKFNWNASVGNVMDILSL